MYIKTALRKQRKLDVNRGRFMVPFWNVAALGLIAVAQQLTPESSGRGSIFRSA
jgi:hypothetical protein